MTVSDGPNAVEIADVPEASEYAGRRGVATGWTVPSSSGEGPVVGADFGGSARADYAIGVHLDTGELVWFAPHLVLRAGPVSD